MMTPTPVHSTLIGTFTPTDYTYPVSKQPFDRRHYLTLPHQSVPEAWSTLAPCGSLPDLDNVKIWTKACTSGTGERLTMWSWCPPEGGGGGRRKQRSFPFTNLLRCKIHCLLVGSLPTCHQFSSTNNNVSADAVPKRAGGGKATEILAARSTARTRRKPAARIPKQTINSKPKEVGSGAQKHAPPNSQANHHLPLLGPRFPLWWAEEDAEGRLIWLEGSVEEGVVEQQQGHKYKESSSLRSRKTPRHLLAATQADWPVKAVKCRVCPEARLNT